MSFISIFLVYCHFGVLLFFLSPKLPPYSEYSLPLIWSFWVSVKCLKCSGIWFDYSFPMSSTLLSLWKFSQVLKSHRNRSLLSLTACICSSSQCQALRNHDAIFCSSFHLTFSLYHFFPEYTSCSVISLSASILCNSICSKSYPLSHCGGSLNKMGGSVEQQCHPSPATSL